MLQGRNIYETELNDQGRFRDMYIDEVVICYEIAGHLDWDDTIENERRITIAPKNTPERERLKQERILGFWIFRTTIKGPKERGGE